ncbi:MAG: polysaccharide deacetylase family protein [Clostridia bacterium]|nr:polysaccharide deacetylase family protein [Clostridia bacterium]
MEMRFPSRRKKAFTLSYDDGVLQDRRLIEIFKRYGLKATFNLNSGLMGRSYTHMGADHSHFKPEEINEVYGGFEISCHTKTHPWLTKLDRREKLIEIAEDKQVLEEITGSKAEGFAYPSGRFDDETIEILKAVGIKYARTIEDSDGFGIPEDFLRWNGTCRHRDERLFKLCEDFLKDDDEIKLFYVWGHSYEFDIENNWDRIENFCKMVSGRDDVWYADNISIVRYTEAYRSLVCEEDVIYNPSDIDVYLVYDGINICVKGKKVYVKETKND